MNLDYDPLIGKYLLDGYPATEAAATQMLRGEGFTEAEAAVVLRIHRHCAEIEARLPPPPPDLLTEAGTLLATVVWKGLAADVARREARRWIAANLRPSRRPHPRGCYSWKHEFEHDARRYIRAGDFATVLVATGIKVVGDRVYAKEVKR